MATERKREKEVAIGSTILGVSRILNLLIGFISRKLFVQIIAVEYLGLNSLYSSVLDFLNLAELGVGVAIELSLYKPLVNHDNQAIGNLLSLTRKIYSIIGTIILVGGLVSSLFLQYLIKDSPFSIDYVRAAFIINVVGISAGYFLADKRILFEADEKYYINTLSDICFRIFTMVAGFVVLYLTKEYLYYVAIYSAQNAFSNITIALIYARKNRGAIAYTKDIPFQKAENKKVLRNLKDVIPSKIGTFVFSSTDAILISTFLGLTAVAIYSNYMLIFNGAFSIASIISTSLVATFGKMIEEKKTQEEIFQAFKKYTILQFMYSSLASVCLFCLIDKFVILWLGDQYTIEKIVVYFMTIDFFIHTMFQPLSTLYTAARKLKEDKIVVLISTLLNIVSSIILIHFYGLPGTILGTLIADFFTYCCRVLVVIKGYFKKNPWLYFGRDACLLALCAGEAVACYFIVQSFDFVTGKYANFIVCAVMCLLVTLVVDVLIEMKYHVIFKKKTNDAANAQPNSQRKSLLQSLLNSAKLAVANHYVKRLGRHPSHQEPIRVVFVCQCEHIFDKIEFLVDKMAKNPSFHVTFLILPEEGKETIETNANIFCNYSNEHVKKLICTTADKRDRIKSLHPDYVFFSRPYDFYLPKQYHSRRIVKYAKTVYVPYGYSLMELGQVSLNAAFMRNIYLFFPSNGYEEGYVKGCFPSANPRLIKPLGYPCLEAILTKQPDNPQSAFREIKQNQGFKVVWTPRWTTDESLGGSNFLRYYKEMFASLLNNLSYRFVFRPHPFALQNYLKTGAISQNEYDAIVSSFSASTNGFYDSRSMYLDTFFDSNCLITDISSIVVEYLLSGNPIIFCHNDGKDILNSTMQEILAVCYQATSFDEVKAYMQALASGEDPLKEQRMILVKKLQSENMGSCDRIIGLLKNRI